MSSTREKKPRLLKHRRSGQAYIQVRDEHGRRRQVTLGKAGTPEAQRRYHQEVVRWHVRQKEGGPGRDDAGVRGRQPGAGEADRAGGRMTLNPHANDVAERAREPRSPPSLRKRIAEYFTRRRTWVDSNGLLWVARGPRWIGWCCEHWLASVAVAVAFLVGRSSAE